MGQKQHDFQLVVLVLRLSILRFSQGEKFQARRQGVARYPLTR